MGLLEKRGALARRLSVGGGRGSILRRLCVRGDLLHSAGLVVGCAYVHESQLGEKGCGGSW